MSCEPGEVIEIDRDDCVDAMHQHGGHYIRVMNLLAATVDVVQQGEQAVGHLTVMTPDQVRIAAAWRPRRQADDR